MDDGSIAFTDDDALNVELTDAIVSGKYQNGNDTYLVMEASVTVMEDDVDKVKERADLLQRASGAATEAIVIGTTITEAAAQQAQEQGVTFIHFDPKGRVSRPPEPD